MNGIWQNCRSVISLVWKVLITRLPGPLFSSLANLRARLQGNPVRFGYRKGKGVFCVEGPHQRQFHDPIFLYNVYLHGIEARAFAVARAYFLDTIEFSRGELVVDVGANMGDVGTYFGLLQHEVRYVAVEPSIKEFECLERNVPWGENHNVALWNEDTTLDFFVSSRNADSSVITPPKYDKKESVTARRLDHVLQTGTQIRLLKLEAEGAEPEVLDGCGDLLNNCDYIAADLGFERGIDQDSTFPEVCNFLSARNFEIVDISKGRLCVLFRNRHSLRP